MASDSTPRPVAFLASHLKRHASLCGLESDDVKQAIANKIIALAKTGERNPDVLCEQALREIRGQQVL